MNKIIHNILIAVISISIISCSDEQGIQNNELADSLSRSDSTLQNELVRETGTVVRGETLSDILLRYKVDFPTITEIVRVSKKVFDLRKIQLKKEYAVYLTNDSMQTFRKFVYFPNPLQFVTVEADSGIKVTISDKPIIRKERRTSGIIKGSLYETLERNKITPLLALKLSEVLAWQVDFYRIREGDEFKVIFEEVFVDSNLIDIGKVKAVYFKHWGHDYYGFHFSGGELDGYFDEEGNSLRKEFLRSPLKFGRISSHYSNRRLHPVLKYYRAHKGTDYAAPTGTPILALGDGMVIERKYNRSSGNYIKIRHNGTYTTGYLHMSRFGKGIRPGVKVRQGQVIGYVGSTGLATGPHVDLRFYKNGAAVDHLKEKFPSVKPIDAELKEAYLMSIKFMHEVLDSIPLDEGTVFSRTEAVNLTSYP